MRCLEVYDVKVTECVIVDILNANLWITKFEIYLWEGRQDLK